MCQCLRMEMEMLDMPHFYTLNFQLNWSTKKTNTKLTRSQNIKTLLSGTVRLLVQHINYKAEGHVKVQNPAPNKGHVGSNWPVESRPLSWLWIRWTLSLAAISLPFSMPALERREPDDWGCILVAEAYFSNMTEGRPCSVVLGVSSTIPLKEAGGKCCGQMLSDTKEKEHTFSLCSDYFTITLHYHHRRKYEWSKY